ncbi:hypothetical protein NC653_029618 [Populus alba x Populus x berolinensis]|uniref:Uncharacterized protein n=1 Tax=Populus alba x Populus x berolinensis TaxID=444605 RepID=A0AAD6M2U6_9ROSI|nr:hypothetical protein NC653_029613 [Populus alba x Populus x berolinensis]KAJ6977772.1 hypothetical protein NC653_029614 [Populus alba x Populus x berolinensis]KAJ6977774.1 hypothetical protein NC653_029616 [Populus alba x Populus x berolinensis]KAJ6977776.1 hypothetical protein NC653_029618 [Populus alba x Populus x berolinensis]
MKIKVGMLAVLGNNQIKAGGFYSRSTIEEAFQKKFDTTSFGSGGLAVEKKYGYETKKIYVGSAIACGTVSAIACGGYFCNVGAADLILSLGNEYVTVFDF